MKKQTTLGLGIAAFGLVAVATVLTNFANIASADSGKQTTEVQVDILAGDICIGATGSIDLGDYTVSSTEQTVTGAFTSPFYVDDLKGADSGYYTTVELSGNLAGPGGADIASSNVYFSSDEVVELITGAANTGVVINTDFSTPLPLSAPITYIERTAGTNNGTVGQYGDTPEIRIDIPAYSAVGSYTATLCYTLYEN